jgi:hypothetical protein
VAVVAPGEGRTAAAPRCCVCDAPIAAAIIATIVGGADRTHLLALHPECAAVLALALLERVIGPHVRRRLEAGDRPPEGG